MLAAPPSLYFIYCPYSLEPVGYGRYRKEVRINKSSKTDMRKQARKLDKEIVDLAVCLGSPIYSGLYG